MVSYDVWNDIIYICMLIGTSTMYSVFELTMFDSFYLITGIIIIAVTYQQSLAWKLNLLKINGTI